MLMTEIHNATGGNEDAPSTRRTPRPFTHPICWPTPVDDFLESISKCVGDMLRALDTWGYRWDATSETWTGPGTRPPDYGVNGRLGPFEDRAWEYDERFATKTPSAHEAPLVLVVRESSGKKLASFDGDCTATWTPDPNCTYHELHIVKSDGTTICSFDVDGLQAAHEPASVKGRVATLTAALETIAAPGCRLLDGGTCLERMEHARDRRNPYEESYRARVLAGDERCVRCIARSALDNASPA